MNARAIAALVVLTVASAGAAEVAPSPELAKLKESYQAEIARVSEPVTKRYAEVLTRLQETFTKAGQLDKALAVKAELDGLVQQKKRLSDKDLDESRWRWGSGGTLTLHRQNRAMHTAWNSPGTWKRMDALTVLVTKGDGTKFTVTFTDGGLTAASVNSDGGGKTSLTRVTE
jgi:hypothetical protein